MESNHNIEYFLKQHLKENDSQENLISQELEHEIFQQFQQKQLRKKSKGFRMNWMQLVASLLFVFFGGTLVGVYIIKPESQTESSLNPKLSGFKQFPKTKQPETNCPSKKINPVWMKEENLTSLTIKKRVDVSQNKELKKPKQAQYELSGIDELPSMLDLSKEFYMFQNLTMDNIEIEKAESEQTKKIIRSFRFVSL